MCKAGGGFMEKDRNKQETMDSHAILQRMDFLNLKVGLERCLEDEDFYLDVLEAFVEENLLNELKGLYLENNWAKYRVKVHTLKSSAAYIGAEDLSAKAKRMELAARDGDDDYINRMHYPLMVKYEDILRQIDRILQLRGTSHYRNQIEKFKLLLVDDNELFRQESAYVLSMNYDVEEAGSGEEMYQKLDSGFIPDLILLDVYMPGADGHRVIKDLRDNERYGDIPVAFMTADNTPESVAKGFREGASEYITKPINREIVEARINRVLHLSRLQKSLQHEVRLRTMADKERNQRVATLFEQIVNALANTITAKDAYTRGHSDRVAKYAVMIAENLQYDQEKLTYVRYAGMLHDIGMIGIPTSLVNKPEKLTEEEYATVKKHTNIGSDILKGITAVPDIAGGAKWHHERYDGTGYPDRLKAMDIPEIARILAVADAYDSMTSDRAFRSRMTQQQVMNELEKGIGKQFDPVFANIMLEIIKNDVDFELREK